MLVSCESNKQLKLNDNNKKHKKILMNVTTKPNIGVKK